MYYPCSENKGADQLRGYREADLRLCFRIGKNPVFSRCGSFIANAQSKCIFSTQVVDKKYIFLHIKYVYVCILTCVLLHLHFFPTLYH